MSALNMPQEERTNHPKIKCSFKEQWWIGQFFFLFKKLLIPGKINILKALEVHPSLKHSALPPTATSLLNVLRSAAFMAEEKGASCEKPHKSQLRAGSRWVFLSCTTGKMFPLSRGSLILNQWPIERIFSLSLSPGPLYGLSTTPPWCLCHPAPAPGSSQQVMR